MIDREFIEQDMELQRYAATPQEMKPRFNWCDVAPSSDKDITNGKLFIEVAGKKTSFSVAEVAETVGKAVTDLALARNEEEIFTEANRQLVSAISRQVTSDLVKRLSDQTSDEQVIVNAGELTNIIEKALIRQNAHDVAKSVIIRKKASDVRDGIDMDDSLTRPVCKVIRRNGEVVAWNQNKIEVAVRSSFLSLGLDSSPAKRIAESLTDRASRKGQEYIRVEDLQDRVQEELMAQGHYKVAEAYILYRAHRAALRAAEIQKTETPAEVSQESMIVVTRADGTSDLWDGQDLRKRIEFATTDLDLILSKAEIETELRRAFFPEMTTEDLKKTVILNAKALIERDSGFNKFAGRILLTYIYEEVLGWDIVRDGVSSLAEFHRRAFKANLVRGVEIDRLSEGMHDYNLDRLSELLDPTFDLDFDYLGIQTLYDRYLIVDKVGEEHKRLETPQLFWLRVSMGIMIEEKDPEPKIADLYRLYASRRFCSSTPTLFNSGTPRSQLSSCYLYKIDDSIESIMQRGIAENAYLSKWAGGLGGSWTAVRGTGSHIHGTNGESQGVIPFLKLHNDQLVAVNQGGKRRGSGCAYLETWHNDIFDFLELRVNTGDERRRTHDMNTANWIPDLFMKRMESRESWTLFRSNDVADLHDLYGKAFEERYLSYEKEAKAGKIFGREIPAIELWKKMLRMIFETGHPWITFKDPCNVRSPQDHAGVVHSSNLCT
ncbi:MAG: ATP cone domain-containing protein, partial [Verrucomicrobiota bacterium]